MRNIFDQYSQAENRLTHALFSALDQDRKILTSFVRDICCTKSEPNVSDLMISVQGYPGGREYTDSEIEARNIPDAWIFDDDGWALVFEAKITAKLTQAQLVGHRRVAEKYGFEKAQFFTIVANEEELDVDGWSQLHWVDIYRWLRRHQATENRQAVEWAGMTADYFEILEAKLLANDKLNILKITSFSGFFANEGEYTYALAKNRIKNAMRLLRQDQRLVKQLGMDPCADGRGAITGRGADGVWDFLRLSASESEENFTKFPHLTLGVGRRSAEAMVSFPNGLRTLSRKALLSEGSGGFATLCQAVLANMENVLEKEPGARPIMRAVQRRYPSQRSIPILDANLEFDLRTAFPSHGKGPKLQRQWIDALFEAVQIKKSNLQFQIGVSFEYDKCPSMHALSALDLMTKGWIACRPLIQKALA